MPEIYNFAAGPSMLPKSVLLRAQAELLDWNSTGVSIMEIGHRTPVFEEMLAGVTRKLRSYLAIPDNYKILFMHGGAQSQFSFIPMNLSKYTSNADYLSSGIWSDRAIQYAQKYINVNVVAKADSSSIPELDQWQLSNDAAYVYYCHNESISGIRMPYIPYVGDVPLVVDMTSSIMTENIDLSQFGLIFASTQKNLGIAGCTLVIIRDDLLGRELDITPEIFNYELQVANNSVLNTVTTVAIYMMDLMLDWLNEQGNLQQVSTMCARKAGKLYDCIDASNGFYTTTVDKTYRSYTNIAFDLPNDTLLQRFLLDAEASGLKYLRGHKVVGGVRASLYTGMPESGVDKLVNFMQDFTKSAYTLCL